MIISILHFSVKSRFCYHLFYASMLKSTLDVLLLLVIIVPCYISCEEAEAFQNLDNESSDCENRCLNISSIRRFSKLGGRPDVNACKRGCRLFGICEWMSSNLIEAQSDCESACLESYEDQKDPSQTACAEGCNIALPLAKERHAKIVSEASNIHALFSPQFPGTTNFLSSSFQDPVFQDQEESIFGPLDNMMQSMMGAASRHFWTVQSFIYSPPSAQVIDMVDGKKHSIFIMEVMVPEINTVHPREKKMTLNTDSNGFKTTLKDFVETNLQTNANRRPSVFDFDFTLDYSDEAWGPSDGGFDGRSKAPRNWWDCFTRKAGLPELVLLIFWVSISMILFMSCLSQFGPRSKKLSVNGDLAFITDNKGELPHYMQAYPAPENCKKSPYYLASVVQASEEEKVPL